MVGLADISCFELVMNSQRYSGCFVSNGFVDKMKAGASGLVDQARYNLGRWKDHREMASVVRHTMDFPTRGVSETQQSMVADELASWEPNFLKYVDDLCFAGNQVNKYAKHWLVGGKRVNLEVLEKLLQDVQTATRKAMYMLGRSRDLCEGRV